MEQDILNTLQEIRSLIYVLIIMLGFVMLIWVINWISNIKRNFKKAWENDFINLADGYFESGDYTKLIAHCKDKLEKYPNHPTATWWLAKAELEIGNNAAAKELFEKVLELEPSWKDTHIEPFLKRISSE